MSTRSSVASGLVLLALLLCLNGSAFAAALAELSFEDPAAVDAWTSTDAEAVLTIARDPANVRGGEAALQFSYFPREETWFIVQTTGLSVAGARSISFAVKTSQATPLIVGLGEQDGSHYDAFIECPENEWVSVRLSLDDLLLRSGDEDENGTLDADQVTDLSFLDCSNMKGEEGRALGWKRGQQYLWLDDIAISDDEVPSTSRRADADGGTEITLGTRTPDCVYALAIGGAKVTLAKAADETVLKAEYGAGAQRWAGFVTPVGQLDLRGLNAMRVRVQTAENVKLHLVLEERDGSKYESVSQVLGGPGWQTVSAPIADFRLDDTSADENEQLDANQLRVAVVVVDTFTSMVGGGGTGALSVGDIVLACSPVPAEPAEAQTEEPAEAPAETPPDAAATGVQPEAPAEAAPDAAPAAPATEAGEAANP